MKRQTTAQVLGLLLLGNMALVSCVDNDYDLSDIDMTLQFGKDGKLTLPTSSTSDIILDNILDINEGDAIEINSETGDYYFKTDGQADGDDINIEVIKISKPKEKDFTATIKLRDIGSGVKGQHQAPAAATGEYYYDISNDARTALEDAEATGISKNVVDIARIGFTPTTYTLAVTISGENCEIMKKVHFDDLNIHLPKGLEVTSCTYKGKEVLTTQAQKDKAKNEGLIVVSVGADTDGYAPASTDPLKLTLTVQAAEISTETGYGVRFFPNEHRANLSGEIIVSGAARLSNDDIDYALLLKEFNDAIKDMSDTEKAAKLAVLNSGDYNEALEMVLRELTFHGDGTFDKDLEVNTISGTLEHDVENIAPIDIDKPDFLDDNDVVLDLYNPQVFLKLAAKAKNGNPFTGIISTDIQMNATGSNPLSVTIDPITFDATTNTKADYVLVKRLYSNTASDAKKEVPAEYANYDMQDQAVVSGTGTSHDLRDLIRDVPDQVTIQGVTSKNLKIRVECTDLKLPQECSVDFEYMLYTPLSFGPDFKVIYSDTENDWTEDLEDVEDFDFGGIEMTATVVSELPLPVRLTLTPIDKDGNEVKGLLVDNIEVPGNATKAVKLSIKPASGYKMRDFFRGKNDKGQTVQKLDGIEYRAELYSTAETVGMTLNSNQKLKVKDAVISLVGGVTYYDE